MGSLLRIDIISVAVACVAFAAASVGPAEARDQLWIAASPSDQSFAKAVSVQFGRAGRFKTPIVKDGGPPAGLMSFCRGVGPDNFDIAFSSRRIASSEVELCNKNGVKDITQVQFGYDALVFVTNKASQTPALSRTAVYLAIARDVPDKGTLASNTSKPANTLYIPSANHGARDVFDEMLMVSSCTSTGAYAIIQKTNPDKSKVAAQCRAARQAANVVNMDSDSGTLARLQSDPKGVGVVTWSFYTNNDDKLKVVALDGVVPSKATVASGTFPIAYPLYLYVKKAQIGQIPGIKEWIAEFTSENAFGPDGYLGDSGLVSMPDAQRRQSRADAQALVSYKP
ncbi:putative phosphate-binding periplasmic protein [Rhodopseudomonas palustris HaA2]|uniref:Putative phosphate-binding periplasmic protein n=2 Tax=Rhodopseudomonas palustris TaxID=1076 RepID=Q2IS78_RHOP2|nr:putative phosphate-binding periplasmic protein [Rhodopseudomonas palustris HaA2]